MYLRIFIAINSKILIKYIKFIINFNFELY